ncbi:MAG: SDR family NAD(P)-dependent oxidoreductase, partial [Acidobacteriota bacterium]|nr:SDR family NAD(P)-dependent oxidoreductase [Acidobacteriota bacterium]
MFDADELLARVRSTAELLEGMAEDRAPLEQLPAEERERLARAVAAFYHPDPIARRRRLKAAERERAAQRAERVGAALEETGIRTLRRKPVFTTPNVFPPLDFDERKIEAEDSRHCYVCKEHYSAIHHFYDQMCPECAEFNLFKRTELADLKGRVALLTGGRVKIGYQAGLKLLRAGARVIVTTRFPNDSARRYAKEADFGEWQDRLQIYGLDMRHTPSVEALCGHLIETLPRLDFIINNACQTVRRPPDFYAHMMQGERAALENMPGNVRRLVGGRDEGGAALAVAAGVARSAELSQVALQAEDLLGQK